MDNKFISVKVSGNPDPNGGFGPLIMFNNPRFELKDVFYGGFESNSYYYSIRIEQSQVVYKIIKNNVRSHGAIRAGALSLAFSIPKGYKVNGYKPYDVLMNLLYTFLKNCMTCRDEIADTYEFNDVRVPLDALDETAEKYTLTESESPWRTMSNDARIGYIQAEENQIEQLINDVQYDEFEKYSEVLIAENVGDNCTFSRITGLEIPRRPVYTIVVDNDSNSIAKTKDVDEPIIREPKVDCRYYECKPIKFTIRELLNGDYVEGVDFNRIAEIINVSTALYKQPKEFNIRVVFTTERNEAAKYLLNGQISIRYNGYEVSLNKDFMFTLKGEEYELLNRLDLFKIIAPESLDIEFDAKPTFDSEKNELKWGTKKKEKQKPAASNNTVTSLVPTGKDRHKVETHSSDVFKLVFVIEESSDNKTIIESINKNNKGVKSKIVVRNGASGETVSKDKLILSLDTIISQGKGKKGKSNASYKRTYLSDEIRIPKPSFKQNKYKVDLYVGNKKFTTGFDYFEEKLVDGCWVVKFSDFKQIPKPIKKIIMSNRVIAFLEGVVLCALLIGGSMNLNKHFCNGNKSQGTTVDTDSVSECDSVVPNVTTEADIKRFLSDYDSILQKNDLSFEEVDKIYKEYNSKDINRCQDIASDICKRIEEYKKVADFIREKNYDGIVDYIKQNNKKINEVHLNLVKLITNGVVHGLSSFEAYDYDSSRRVQVKNSFMANDFQSFSDLLIIAETYRKPAPKPAPKPTPKPAPKPTPKPAPKDKKLSEL